MSGGHYDYKYFQVAELADNIEREFLKDGKYEGEDWCAKPDFRGKQAGRELAKAVIKAAKTIGYEYIRLDTLPSMESANTLYRSLGFKPMGPYRYNPFDGAVFMELNLKDLKGSNSF